jgi:hypothetical protein
LALSSHVNLTPANAMLLMIRSGIAAGGYAMGSLEQVDHPLLACDRRLPRLNPDGWLATSWSRRPRCWPRLAQALRCPTRDNAASGPALDLGAANVHAERALALDGGPMRKTPLGANAKVMRVTEQDHICARI